MTDTKQIEKNYLIEDLSACVGFLNRLPHTMRTLPLFQIIETLSELNDQLEPAEAKAFRLRPTSVVLGLELV